MNLIALLAGLFIERLVTNLLHLREVHWLDRYFDWGQRQLKRANRITIYLAVVIQIAVPVIPVLVASVLLEDILLPYLAFAILVLLFSLGPRDLGEEVNDYCEALEHGDRDAAKRVARELLEADAPRDPARRQREIEEAIFVQANNRVFGVVFWFMILGPTGAWIFRVADLARRHAVMEHGADTTASTYVHAVQSLQGVLAWIPARLLALGYALAGSFEDAVSGWKDYYQDCAERLFDVNEDVLACVGKGAIRMGAGAEADVDAELHTVRSAMRLVNRTLIIWLFVIAVMTLVGVII